MARPKARAMEVFYGDDGITGRWTRKAMIAANEVHLNDLRAAHGDSFYPIQHERHEESRSAIKMTVPQTPSYLGKRAAMEPGEAPKIAAPDVRASVGVDVKARRAGRPREFA